YFLLSTERIEKNQVHSEIPNLYNLPIDHYQSNTGLAITAIIPAKLQSAPLSLRALSLYQSGACTIYPICLSEYDKLERRARESCNRIL
ncbi:MAG: hypothetical protein R6T98_11465, partial [Desulfatiglandales bacterium]